MLQKKYILIIFLLLTASGVWAKFGEKAMATVSYQTYETQTYSYDVEIDQFYDEKGVINSHGILVHLHPEKDTQNPSQFSPAYWQTNENNLRTVLTASEENKMVDVLLIFKQPLSFIETEQLLAEIEADVFESGLVGFKNNIPFAHYAVEKGSLSQAMWQEIETTIYEEDLSKEDVGQSRILGYMAVRVWVKAHQLPHLLVKEQIEVVDVTPQIVRDTLAHNNSWRNTPILSLSLDMPVWAYKWE